MLLFVCETLLIKRRPWASFLYSGYIHVVISRRIKLTLLNHTTSSTTFTPGEHVSLGAYYTKPDMFNFLRVPSRCLLRTNPSMLSLFLDHTTHLLVFSFLSNKPHTRHSHPLLQQQSRKWRMFISSSFYFFILLLFNFKISQSRFPFQFTNVKNKI